MSFNMLVIVVYCVHSSISCNIFFVEIDHSPYDVVIPLLPESFYLNYLSKVNGLSFIHKFKYRVSIQSLGLDGSTVNRSTRKGGSSRFTFPHTLTAPIDKRLKMVSAMNPENFLHKAWLRKTLNGGKSES